MGVGEKVFPVRSRKEGSEAIHGECKTVPAIHRDDCAVGPQEWRLTDGGAPGMRCSQMTSHPKGNGDIGLEGTRLCI